MLRLQQETIKMDINLRNRRIKLSYNVCAHINLLFQYFMHSHSFFLVANLVVEPITNLFGNF